MSSSMDRDRDQSHRDVGRGPAPTALSREVSDVMAPPTMRRTDVRTEMQPNGSEVTTTIVEFTDQVTLTLHRKYGKLVSVKSIMPIRPIMVPR